MILITCDIDDSVVIRGTLTDEDGNTVVGATVTARALPPDGVEVDLGGATDEGLGVYSVTLDPDASGSWFVRLESAAPTKAAAEGVVYVRETRFA